MMSRVVLCTLALGPATTDAFQAARRQIARRRPTIEMKGMSDLYGAPDSSGSGPETVWDQNSKLPTEVFGGTFSVGDRDRSGTPYTAAPYTNSPYAPNGALSLRDATLSEAARAIEKEMDMEKTKARKDYGRLKQLKSQLKAQSVVDEQRIKLEAELFEAEAREDYDKCEELQTQLDAIETGWETSFIQNQRAAERRERGIVRSSFDQDMPSSPGLSRRRPRGSYNNAMAPYEPGYDGPRRRMRRNDEFDGPYRNDYTSGYNGVQRRTRASMIRNEYGPYTNGYNRNNDYGPYANGYNRNGPYNNGVTNMVVPNAYNRYNDNPAMRRRMRGGYDAYGPNVYNDPYYNGMRRRPRGYNEFNGAYGPNAYGPNAYGPTSYNNYGPYRNGYQNRFSPFNGYNSYGPMAGPREPWGYGPSSWRGGVGGRTWGSTGTVQ